jgi:hypothetical protein
MFAKEGADVAIVYLENEEQDAKETQKMIEKENRKCILIVFLICHLITAKRY